MPFIADILKRRSLSIVGLEKNTGKTVCLNYILGRLNELGASVAVTSIGVDGEQTDSVFGTAKPEITLYRGTRFITSERHYNQRQLISVITDVDERRTSMGRLVTAEVLQEGKVILSGAATTELLRRQIEHLHEADGRLVIVDGALSRLSLASPTVTDAMILATGAAVSPNLQQLVSKTRFQYSLINLEAVECALREQLGPLPNGLWAVDSEGEVHDLEIPSGFLLSRRGKEVYRYGSRFFAAGAVSDYMLKHFAAQKAIGETELIIRDFTKLFITQEALAEYRRRGGRLRVLLRTPLIAITLNPTSPQGYHLNSHEACSALEEALQIPVYDVRKL